MDRMHHIAIEVSAIDEAISWYKKNKSLHSKKVSHLIIDERASRKIKNLEDLKMFETLLGKTE